MSVLRLILYLALILNGTEILFAYQPQSSSPATCVPDGPNEIGISYQSVVGICLRIEQREARAIVDVRGANAQPIRDSLQSQANSVGLSVEVEENGQVQISKASDRVLTSDDPSRVNARDMLSSVQRWLDAIKSFYPNAPAASVVSLPRDQKIRLSQDARTKIADAQRIAGSEHAGDIAVFVQGANGTVVDLGEGEGTSYIFSRSEKPLVLVTVGNIKADQLCSSNAGWALLAHCFVRYALARRSDGSLVIAAVQYDQGTIISADVINDSRSVVMVNNRELVPGKTLMTYANSQNLTLTFYRRPLGCRIYPPDPADSGTLVLRARPKAPAGVQWMNGIQVGQAKIFDTQALREMLSATDLQLKALSGFSGQPIFNAIGTLQGIARDSSYFSAQVTTTPLPGSSVTNVSGSTGSDSTVGVTPTTAGTITISCPAGTVPASVGTGPTCVASSGAPGSQATMSTTVGGSATQTKGGTTSDSSTTSVTAPQVNATVPVTPNLTPFSSPSNISVAAQDLLAEQVQLNSQMNVLRLLLQGAVSDQYAAVDNRAVGLREQTTIGFSVSIDPPRQYPNAVAEVHIILVPQRGRRGPSIMNLLPAEKTYNVAKVTSHSNAFGAGVAITPISVGVNTGKSKDRLYLAKDTDTLALLLPNPSGNGDPSRAPKEPWIPVGTRVRDKVKSFVTDNRLHNCPAFESDTDGAVAFGWQFRPVLGEKYVRGGQRQVFAQLALPNGDDDDVQPTIYVQTLWREYDAKRRVLGATYINSCSVVNAQDDIVLRNPIRIRSIEARDIASGQIRLRADGDFFASGMNIRSASQNVAPVVFDGKDIEVFGNLRDLMRADSLDIVASNGHRQPFSVVNDPTKSCRPEMLSATALPKPDGTSKVQIRLGLAKDYNLSSSEDGVPAPFVMFGQTVIGTLDQPFNERDGNHCDLTSRICTYSFVTSTSGLRASPKLVISDLTRENFRSATFLKFGPSFTSLQAATDHVYLLAGSDLESADFGCLAAPSDTSYCVKTTVNGQHRITHDPYALSNSNATVRLDDSESSTKHVELLVEASDGERVLWNVPMPEIEKAKLTASPSVVYLNDSVTVTLRGIDFSKAKSVSFESTDISFSPAKSKDSRQFTLSTAISRTTGTKEFAVEFTEGDKQTFKIDVVKH